MLPGAVLGREGSGHVPVPHPQGALKGQSRWGPHRACGRVGVTVKSLGCAGVCPTPPCTGLRAGLHLHAHTAAPEHRLADDCARKSSPGRGQW